MSNISLMTENGANSPHHLDNNIEEIVRSNEDQIISPTMNQFAQNYLGMVWNYYNQMQIRNHVFPGHLMQNWRLYDHIMSYPYQGNHFSSLLNSRGPSVSNLPGNVSGQNVVKYTFDLTQAHTAFDPSKYQVKYHMTDYGDVLLPVSCGQNDAMLQISKLSLGSKGESIFFNGSWWTPNYFQEISGRKNAKDWKRSIRHNGKSLKSLIAYSVLVPHGFNCICVGCRIPNNRNFVQGYRPFTASIQPVAETFGNFQPPLLSSENMMTPTSSIDASDFNRVISNDKISEERSTEEQATSSFTSSRKTPSINAIAESLIKAQKMKNNSSKQSTVEEVGKQDIGGVESEKNDDSKELSNNSFLTTDDKPTSKEPAFEKSSVVQSSPTRSETSKQSLQKRQYDLIDLNTTSHVVVAKRPRASQEEELPMVELAPIPSLKQRTPNQDDNRYPLRPLIIRSSGERSHDFHAPRSFDFQNQNRVQSTNIWRNTFQATNPSRESLARNQIVEAAEEMSRWSVFQVGLFLDMIGCGMYKEIFDRHCINGDSLPFLQLGNLLALGLPIGHAHTIIARVHLRLGTYPEVLKAIHGNEI